MAGSAKPLNQRRIVSETVAYGEPEWIFPLILEGDFFGLPSVPPGWDTSPDLFGDTGTVLNRPQ